jgi:hypothetical protein
MTCPRHHYGDGPPEQETEGPGCYICRLEQEMARFMPRQPNYRYFTGPNGWMYCWTTERMSDGKYAAFVYRTEGKGARSGKATSYRKIKELHFTKRTTAKARALMWLNTARKRAAAVSSSV